MSHSRVNLNNTEPLEREVTGDCSLHGLASSSHPLTLKNKDDKKMRMARPGQAGDTYPQVTSRIREAFSVFKLNQKETLISVQ